MRTVPEVKNAGNKSMPEHDGLMLPGNTTVAYSCASGYELENPDNNIAKCEYEFKDRTGRSEEHTSELQSRETISYAVFCLKKKTKKPV